nr:MAG TPA: hypothetical protein [Caudoviricetes sp.]
MLRSAEFSASINSNAGNPFNRFDQHKNSTLWLMPQGFSFLRLPIGGLFYFPTQHPHIAR